MKHKKEPMNSSNFETQFAVLVEKVNNIEKGVSEIQVKLEKNYVTNDRFEPVRNIVYGLIALITIGVVGALLSLIVVRK